MIKFLPLGGSGEIGASCFYLNISGTGIILDCGIHPRRTGIDSLPDFDLIKNEPVDYVIISHAHQDHMGALPYLVQKHPYIKIVTTPQTRAIAELTLHNAVSILKEQISEEDNFRIYSHEEIDLLIKSIDYKSYDDKFVINGYKHNSNFDITACFLDAGHILGSAGILIDYGAGKLFYTGDINLEDQSLQTGAELPEEKIDILITETTYGSTDSGLIPDWDSEIIRMASEFNKVFVNGGSVLIPVFSLGKTQEIITVVWKLMLENKIPVVDIYSGGIALKINRIYDYSKYTVNRTDPEFEISSIPQNDLYAVDNFNRFFKNPCVVLAPSGMMLFNTASYNLARRWINEKDSAIFIVGYVDEETPGYIFANSSRGDVIEFNGRKFEVKCDIRGFKFSAHSNREGLLEIVKRTDPDSVILVHGDPQSLNWIGASVKKNSKNKRVIIAERGKVITL